MQLLPGFPASQPLGQQQQFLEAAVGHPGDLFAALIADIVDQKRTTFASIQSDWLRLMWALDTYRVHRVPPSRMGDPRVTNPLKRLDAIYRGKGDWFARVLTELLKNQTGLDPASQSKVEGLSQNHQIDIAWPCEHGPDPISAPEVCIETKLSGAPGFDDTEERGPLADYVSRRKEVKFAAADLKLKRRITQPIHDWDVWRKAALPAVFFLWGTRLTKVEDGEKVKNEVEALLRHYVDGAGVLMWIENEAGTGYEVPAGVQLRRELQLDKALYEAASTMLAAAARPSSRPSP